MTIDEINILTQRLRELIKLIPNDEYITNLYESTLKEKHRLESESLDIRPTKKELALYQIALNRKLNDNNMYNDEVINFIKNNYKRDVNLQNRKIQLHRICGSWYSRNELQNEANNLINNMIYEHFLNAYHDSNRTNRRTRFKI